MKKGKRPTLSDVARHAQVSTITVSRVLHDTGPVSHDMRQRVEMSIATLGYRPRQIARLPAEGSIAVLTGDLLNPFFPEIVRGIQDEADNYGMILTLYNLTDHSQRQQQILHKLSRQNIDGIIIMGTAPFPELLTWHEHRDVPLIVINRRLSQPGVHCILVDFENAICRATQHLLSFSHTRIGYLAPSRNSEVAQARRRGLDAALRDAGLNLRPEWCVTVPPGSDVTGGFQAMRALLDLPSPERPTGIIAFNDGIAVGALHAMRISGLRVPQDISIVGVDDISFAAYTCPPLTTIGQPKYQMGKLAVQALQQMSEGQTSLSGSCTLLESPLIVRESTGPAPLTSPVPIPQVSSATKSTSSGNQHT